MKREPIDAPRAVTSNTYVPIAVAISAAIMAGAGVFWYQTDRGKLSDEIKQVASTVERLAASVQTLADSSDRLSRTDMLLWCLRAERINPAFRCPDEAPVPHIAGWVTQVEGKRR